MIIFKNFIVPGKDGKPMSTDITLKHNGNKKPLVIYVHGFNGFKDWGNFNLIAQQFAEAGFVLVKFNFSHNGTTPDDPEEFTDLQAYAENNYTTQLDELGQIIDWCVDEKHYYVEEIDRDNIYLVGHSLGGGLVILKAAEDDRVKKIATWAAISECKTPWGNWDEEQLKTWKESGVAHVANSRTKQQMPLHYQLFLNYQHNLERLDIKQAISKLTIPTLICHGTQDEAVTVDKAKDLKAWQPNAALFL
ncbi:MAG: alpha/beta fold hydrolase, partial [Chitinophagaceae bacterium]|nr:alpha/beta fold hydrolase [Chitinophagaceae bacterium]